MYFFQNNLRSKIGPFNLTTQAERSSHFDQYLHYYQLIFKNINYYNGYINVNDENIFVQVFKPENSIGTVYLIHGYFDHLGYLQPIIEKLLSMQYTVVGYDKIGHGLSTGERANISTFEHYVQTLDQVIKITAAKVPPLVGLIGHSTGGATIIDYLLTKNNTLSSTKIILLAPLVRSHRWYSTMLASILLDKFITKIPRNFKDNADQKFIHFRRNDPLQPKYLPLQWVRAMKSWNEKIVKASPISMQLQIIQGKKDKVVDWKYNCDFLLTKFMDSKVHYIEDGRHHIAVENETSKNTVLEIIGETFANN
jgi:alpha-beta hydrolase superfamily lysophospholipase